MHTRLRRADAIDRYSTKPTHPSRTAFGPGTHEPLFPALGIYVLGTVSIVFWIAPIHAGVCMTACVYVPRCDGLLHCLRSPTPPGNERKIVIKQASIAATILALASTSAQAEVTLYGKADLGIVHESGGAAGSVNKLSSGAMAPSRLGVKANFDLGDGLKAKAQFETGLCADSNNNPAGQYCTGGTFMGRRATLGLEGGFGELSVGRQFTPAFLNIDNFDPFGTGTAGQVNNLFHAPLRANNSIIYSIPSMGGLSGSVMYAFGEVQGNNTANRQTGASIGYVAGPFSVGAAFNDLRAADSTSTKDGNVGASYDFGVATLNGMFQRTTGKNQYMIGTTVPAGGGTIMASFVSVKDRTDAANDATQVGVGYTRPINKMLKAYVAYAHINNKNAAAYTVGNGTDDGTGNSAFNAGLVLSF